MKEMKYMKGDRVGVRAREVQNDVGCRGGLEIHAQREKTDDEASIFIRPLNNDSVVIVHFKPCSVQATWNCCTKVLGVGKGLPSSLLE